MKLLKISPKYSLSLALVVALGSYVWFRVAPVGVNNYVNKVTLQMLLQSPELMTSIGAIDNTSLDFHSGKLSRYDEESDAEMLEFL